MSARSEAYFQQCSCGRWETLLKRRWCLLETTHNYTIIDFKYMIAWYSVGMRRYIVIQDVVYANVWSSLPLSPCGANGHQQGSPNSPSTMGDAGMVDEGIVIHFVVHVYIIWHWHVPSHVPSHVHSHVHSHVSQCIYSYMYQHVSI